MKQLIYKEMQWHGNMQEHNALLGLATKRFPYMISILREINIPYEELTEKNENDIIAVKVPDTKGTLHDAWIYKSEYFYLKYGINFVKKDVGLANVYQVNDELLLICTL